MVKSTGNDSQLKRLQQLSIVTLLFTVIVIGVGAFTRLTDSGLGCPDWPGCYGQITVPSTQEAIDTSKPLYQRPLEQAKAWAEMIHRYLASALGLFILGIAFQAWRAREQVSLKIPLFMVALVCFQGALGMWTVTLGLLPIIVMGHLLGGFLLASSLLIWNLKLRAPANRSLAADASLPNQQPQQPKQSGRTAPLKHATRVGIVLVAIQIALGGWTAANYAATVCTELPICQSGWAEMFTLEEALTLHVRGVSDYEFAPHLSTQAKISIHVKHRIGAIVVTVFLTWLILALWRSNAIASARRQVKMLAAVLVAQIALGVSNVVFMLPIAVAVSHNLMGLALLLTLLGIHERFPFSARHFAGAFPWTMSLTPKLGAKTPQTTSTQPHSTTTSN